MSKYSATDQEFFTGLVERFGSELLSENEEFLVIHHNDGRQTFLHKWRTLPIAEDGRIVGSVKIEDRILELLQT